MSYLPSGGRRAIRPLRELHIEPMGEAATKPSKGGSKPGTVKSGVFRPPPNPGQVTQPSKTPATPTPTYRPPPNPGQVTQPVPASMAPAVMPYQPPPAPTPISPAVMPYQPPPPETMAPAVIPQSPAPAEAPAAASAKSKLPIYLGVAGGVGLITYLLVRGSRRRR